jgi:hypothetical protein
MGTVSAVERADVPDRSAGFGTYYGAESLAPNKIAEV